MSDNENRQDIRIVIAGHVDHGKSTVIGRLLADTGSLPQGKLEQIREKCRRTSRPFEYAFLLDALKDEQAQGVTIDSARCFFKTKTRNYLIIDAPGHTEFIKNMVTGASRADAALLVIDAAEGIMDNSKRHAMYLSLLGIEQICVLVNKMDLADYSEERFKEIEKNYSEVLRQIGIKSATFIPVSGFNGDNIACVSKNMNWYTGKTVLQAIEGIKSKELPLDKPFRMPVQDIYKFTGDGDQRRIIAGTVDSGSLCVGDEVVFYPSGKRSHVQSIEGFNIQTDKTYAGCATGFTLTDQIYVRRGELAAKSKETPPQASRRFRATIIWLGKKIVSEGNRYKLKCGTAHTTATVEKILNVTDASDLSLHQKEYIEKHEIAECILSLDGTIAFDTAAEIPSAGRFVLIDDFNIAGGGIIMETLAWQETKDNNLFLSSGKVSYDERCKALGQKGTVLWFTGLSGAGKSTIAIELERELMNRGRLAYRLDGDNIRDGLNSNLGFSISDREENIRRISEVAKLFHDSGMITLVSFISPLRSMRERAKSAIGEDDFVEVYVKASLKTCVARDTKGLYAKAAEGKIKNFTGVSSPYEVPDCPDLVLDTENNDIGDCVNIVLDYLEKHQQV